VTESSPPASGGERTLLQEMLRPASLGLLVLALALALGFAALGQWQLSRAVQSGTVLERPTETVRPLSAVARPQSQQTDASVGQLVTTSGRYVAADFVVVADRLNRGVRGYWVVGHAVVDRPAGAQLAVGLGWTADRSVADRVAAELRASPPVPGVLAGRYIDSDAAEPSTSGSPRSLTAVSTAQLLNLWTDADGPVYEGVLTLRSAPAGLDAIYSPRPEAQVELNLLNLFYAFEWGLFALIAVYVWYRLVRDRWELAQLPEEEEEEDDDDEGEPVAAGAESPPAYHRADASATAPGPSDP
jgi:surfeit locus 1 family protein